MVFGSVTIIYDTEGDSAVDPGDESYAAPGRALLSHRKNCKALIETND